MPISNNMVVAKDDFLALREAVEMRQPGDTIELRHVKLKIVENLPDRISFDVLAADPSAAAPAMEGDDDEPQEESSILAKSVLGVMTRKR
jgi:hypothetical protein